MFIGHFAPAFVAAAYPRAPGLGTLFVGAQLVDFGFFGLAMAGVERFRVVPGFTETNALDLYHMPFTHSLLGSAVWAAGFALLIWLATKNRTGAVLAGAVVLSHWLLDWLVHVPDLTLAGGEPKLGLGLWNLPVVAMPLEAGLLFAAFAFYWSRTKPTSRWTGWAGAALAALLALFQAINWFGPPPEAANMELMTTALASFTIAALAAWWLEQTRRAGGAPLA